MVTLRCVPSAPKALLYAKLAFAERRGWGRRDFTCNVGRKSKVSRLITNVGNNHWPLVSCVKYTKIYFFLLHEVFCKSEEAQESLKNPFLRRAYDELWTDCRKGHCRNFFLMGTNPGHLHFCRMSFHVNFLRFVARPPRICLKNLAVIFYLAHRFLAVYPCRIMFFHVTCFQSSPKYGNHGFATRLIWKLTWDVKLHNFACWTYKGSSSSMWCYLAKPSEKVLEESQILTTICEIDHILLEWLLVICSS